MKDRNIKYIIVLLLSMPILLAAQSGTNPFRVIHVKKNQIESDNSKGGTKINHNIVTTKESVETNSNESVETKLSERPINVIKTSPKTTRNESIEKDQNPFAVNYSKVTNQKKISKSDLDTISSKDDVVTDDIVTDGLVESVDTSAIVTIDNSKKIHLQGQEVNPFALKHQKEKQPKEVKQGNELKTSKEEKLIEAEGNLSQLPKIKKFGSQPIDKHLGTSDFIFWIIIFTIFIFAILINYKRSFILKSYRGILNENYLKLIKREEQNGFSGFFLSLLFVFVLSFGAFIYLVLLKNYNFNSGIWGYLSILLALIVTYLIRLLVFKLLGYVFSINAPLEKFFFIVLYYNVLLGICLLIVNVLFAFGSESLSNFSYYIGLFTIGLLLVIRYVRGLLLSIQQSFLLKIHFFFYLCAVEIAPVLIFIKILSNFVQ